MVAVAAAEPHERHVRLRTPSGAVHLWTPANYDADTAATVVYVHGYYADVDHAWVAYRLAAQFRASKLNALFVACEAPTSDAEPVPWTSLEALLDAVSMNERLPEGKLVAVGHSGAYRTLVEWLDEPRLDTIVLVDAAYGDLRVFAKWLEDREGRRLIDVGDQMSRAQTELFHESLSDTFAIDRFPTRMPDEARRSRVVYVRSGIGHMRLVTGGAAIPTLLGALVVPFAAPES
jgi:hypothetical protein